MTVTEKVYIEKESQSIFTMITKTVGEVRWDKHFFFSAEGKNKDTTWDIPDTANFGETRDCVSATTSIFGKTFLWDVFFL